MLAESNAAASSSKAAAVLDGAVQQANETNERDRAAQRRAQVSHCGTCPACLLVLRCAESSHASDDGIGSWMGGCACASCLYCSLLV